MGAMPMGAPGWPELACCTMSAERTRMVLMVLAEMSIIAYASCVVMKSFSGDTSTPEALWST